MSSISSFDITSVVVSEPKIFLYILHLLLVLLQLLLMELKHSELKFDLQFSLMVRLLLVMNQEAYQDILLIISSYIFNSLISADGFLAKSLQRFAACVLVNDNLCGKLVMSLGLPIIIDDNVKIVSFFYFYRSF